MIRPKSYNKKALDKQQEINRLKGDITHKDIVFFIFWVFTIIFMTVVLRDLEKCEKNLK